MKGYLSSKGKKPTKLVIEKWDTQFDFVNQEVETRKQELREIILNYCKYNLMTFMEVLAVVEEIREGYLHNGYLVDGIEKAE